MKRQLTFPLIRMILSTLCLIFLLSFIGVGVANAFLPTFPKQLTLLTKNGQYHQTLCPKLTNTIENRVHGKTSTPFKLLNWNIYKQQKENWGVRLTEWANEADFITLQEAKLSPKLIELSHQKQFFYLQNYAFEHNNLIYGVNTLSKVAPTSLCGSTYNEPWILIPKTAVASTYPIHGSEQLLLIVNIHGVNFTFTEQPLHEQLAPYIELIMQHKGPVIFSGDFNTWSDARLADVKQSLIKSGFSETPFNEDKRMKMFGLPLDHIFFRGLKVIDAQSIETDASDHSPQFVTFDLIPA